MPDESSATAAPDVDRIVGENLDFHRDALEVRAAALAAGAASGTPLDEIRQALGAQPGGSGAGSRAMGARCARMRSRATSRRPHAGACVRPSAGRLWMGARRPSWLHPPGSRPRSGLAPGAPGPAGGNEDEA